MAEARDEATFGGKAVALATAIRSGLPVPPGVALATDLVDAIAHDDPAARDRLERAAAELGGPFAVRSSAVGEDSTAASFAGQHATVLNVVGIAEVSEAVGAVWRSARSESAAAYRERVGADMTVRIGVIVQRLIAADVAGVLFTSDPVTGARELVVEASWGLGEAVVQGLVIPDRYRIARGGEVLARTPGWKTVAVRLRDGGDTYEEAVGDALIERLCIGDSVLHAIHDLAAGCDRVFGPGPHDIEWAVQSDVLYLLQRRPVTTFLPAATDEANQDDP
ncbi:MAG TPA: PEP/pyruvate-binding domain-containing protein [Patescibacteria group bacterium]|nr:PEP/pyruvate-binding domain-containing protein [Patescibacteria group bacterium]